MAVKHCILLLILLATYFATAYDHKGNQVPPNAQHIFNAIHSSMRQWGSSLNHNGMSFFLAKVPKGVHLHHGRGGGIRVEGMDWLAFEPEHALNFAWDVYECHDPKATSMSLKWSFPEVLDRFQQQAKDLESNDGDQAVLKTSPHPHPPPLCIKAGYLHTYAVARELSMLYIDGQSAAKTRNGTLDSQDYIFPYNNRNRTWYDDGARAQHLCSVALNTWKGQIDGFIRMEHGFEMILCDFSNLDLVNILEAEHPATVPKFLAERTAADALNIFSAIAARYFDIGGKRVRVYYDTFVTAFAYPNLNLFADEASFPRLTSISKESASQIRKDVSSLVLSSPELAESVDWQSITTLLTTRYTRPLQYFSTPDAFQNSTSLAVSINLLLAPYISHSRRNATLEISRCATAFVPQNLLSFPPSSQSLAQRAFLTVSHKLCSSLHAVMSDPSLPLKQHQSKLRELIDWLAWPDFKYCSHDRACGLDEVCFTAIWPWGTGAETQTPRCKNGSALSFSRGDWAGGIR